MADERVRVLVERVDSIGRQTHRAACRRIANFLVQTVIQNQTMEICRRRIPGFDLFLDHIERLEKLQVREAAFSIALNRIDRYIRFSLFGRRSIDFSGRAADSDAAKTDDAAPVGYGRPAAFRLKVDTSRSTRSPFAPCDSEKIEHPAFRRLRWQTIENVLIDMPHMTIYDLNNDFWELHPNLTDSFIKSCLDEGEADTDLPPSDRNDSVLYIAAEVHLHHYGHWLAESLASLASIASLPENTKVLLPENLSSPMRQTLELTGWMGRIQFVKGRVARVRKLMVPSTMLEPFPHYPFVRDIYSRMIQNAGGTQTVSGETEASSIYHG